MPDHATPLPKEPQAPESNTQTPPSSAEAFSLKRTHLVASCGAGLIVCFFLPWLQFLSQTTNGFQIATQGENTVLLWSIPIMGAIACLAGAISHTQYKVAAVAAGLTPIVILIYAAARTSADLFKVLQIGAWITLALAVILLVSARK